MSESASDPKVEDVLSSVRRLVSGELPRKPRPDLPEGPGALVLTPADRIEESPKVRAASKSLEERIAELEAAVGDRGDEFEPDGSEDQAQHRPDRIVYTRPPSGDEVAEARRSTLRLSKIALIETGPANDDDEDDAERGTTAEFHHEEDHADEAAEAPMAVDVAPARPAPAEVAAFTNPDEVVARLEARLEGNQASATPAALSEVSVELDMEDQAFEDALSEAVGNGGNDADHSDDAEEAAQAPDFAPELATYSDHHDHPAEAAASDEANAPAAYETGDELGVAEAFEVVEDSIEDPAQDEAAPSGDPDDAQDSVFAARQDDDETDDQDDGPEAVADSPYALTDAPDDDPDLPEIAPEPAEDAASADPAAALVSAALDKLADEDATRLLVARLIREELQGDLGERITRNVRKLVRREIMRALNSRDLT